MGVPVSSVVGSAIRYPHVCGPYNIFVDNTDQGDADNYYSNTATLLLTQLQQ